MMLELRHYRSFVALAEELHFGRAALQLNLAQPALTRQIQAMEAHLGVQLLSRSQRRVELTAAGHLLLQRCRGILASASEAERDARRAASGELGRLTIGFVHSATYGLLPNLLQPFRRAYPDVELQLREMRTLDQVAALSQDVIDVGLIRPSLLPAGLEVMTVLQERFVVAVPIDHPSAARGKVSLQDLRDQSFVMFSQRESPMFHSAIVSMCAQAGFQPRVAQEATHIQTVLSLVACGFGIAIVPEIAHNISASQVAYADIVDRLSPIQVLLAWSSLGLTPTGRAFRRIAQTYARRAPTGGDDADAASKPE